MYPKELVEGRIIGFIVRKRSHRPKSEARHDVAHKLITARVTETGFLDDGDLYIESVSAEVLLVKSTHQLSVWGEREKIAFISEGRGQWSHSKAETESAIHSGMASHAET